MGDALFHTIERFQAAKPWGRFLDAGTGPASLKWIQNISTSSFTAITADNQMKQSILNDANVKPLRPCDSLVVGNWMDDSFCSTLGTYDTILADYLIGAVDGFSPYEQDTILEKLRGHLNPKGRLYVIGMNPIPDQAAPPADIITEVRRVRDSCILLAGHRPYREFPLSWMKRHLERSRFKVIASKNFTILHGEESILRQLRVGQSKLPLIANLAARQGMDRYLNDIAERVKVATKSTETGKIPLSFDYVICAEPYDCESESNNHSSSSNSSHVSNNSSSVSSSNDSSPLGKANSTTAATVPATTSGDVDMDAAAIAATFFGLDSSRSNADK